MLERKIGDSGRHPSLRKMETLMDSADAKKLLDDTIESLRAHRRVVIDEDITYSDLNERVRHMEIMLRIKAGSDERDVWPIRKKILDMHRVERTEWPEKLKAQVGVNPRTKPYVAETGKPLRWLKKMSVTEYIKVEWGPPCSIAKDESGGDIVATFRTSNCVEY